MRDIIKYGSVLMLFNLIAGALLAFVYIKTTPIIEANKMAAAGENVMAEVLPGVSGGFDQKGEGSDFPYWTGYTDSGKRNIGGYVFITREKGYSSTIESMVGIDIDGTICDDIPNEDSHLYATAKCFPEALKITNKWYQSGNIITFFTARESKDREVTEKWLKNR